MFREKRESKSEAYKVDKYYNRLVLKKYYVAEKLLPTLKNGIYNNYLLHNKLFDFFVIALMICYFDKLKCY